MLVNRREFLAAAARAGLLAGVLGDARALFAATEERTIRGRVAGGGKPLGGVAVSDGCQVVRTNADGVYELAIGPHSAPFVFVTTPRGYWADIFYVPVGKAAEAGRADFALREIEQPDRFDFVFMADMHIEKRQWGIPKCKASLREINGLEPSPAFVWAQGDICLQSGMGEEYVECLALCKMPVRNGPGNHEMMLRHKDPRDDFHRLFGPAYYSFDWGRVHCVVCDGDKVIVTPKGRKAVIGTIEGSELKWLEADLAAQPPGTPILVGVHIPIVSTYPQRRKSSPDYAPYWQDDNTGLLTDLFARHKVKMVLQGHMHENERLTVKGVEYVETISLSGSWWAAKQGFERGVDASPRGYRIVSVDGTSITHRYVSSCESHVARQGEFVGLRKQDRPSKQAGFVFNCYDAPNESTAQARIDDGPWRPMPAWPGTRWLKVCHQYRLVADTTGLKPGKHTIEARVAWPGGTVVTEKASFVIRDHPAKAHFSTPTTGLA